jgi:hypothetical protein
VDGASVKLTLTNTDKHFRRLQQVSAGYRMILETTKISGYLPYVVTYLNP